MAHCILSSIDFFGRTRNVERSSSCTLRGDDTWSQTKYTAVNKLITNGKRLSRIERDHKVMTDTNFWAFRIDAHHYSPRLCRVPSLTAKKEGTTGYRYFLSFANSTRALHKEIENKRRKRLGSSKNENFWKDKPRVRDFLRRMVAKLHLDARFLEKSFTKRGAHERANAEDKSTWELLEERSRHFPSNRRLILFVTGKPLLASCFESSI